MIVWNIILTLFINIYNNVFMPKTFWTILFGGQMSDISPLLWQIDLLATFSEKPFRIYFNYLRTRISAEECIYGLHSFLNSPFWRSVQLVDATLQAGDLIDQVDRERGANRNQFPRDSNDPRKTVDSPPWYQIHTPSNGLLRYMKYEVLHAFHEIILEVRVINSYRAGVFPRFTFFCKFLFETFLHQSCQSLFFPYREFCSVAKGPGLNPGITVGGGLGWWSMLPGLSLAERSVDQALVKRYPSQQWVRFIRHCSSSLRSGFTLRFVLKKTHEELRKRLQWWERQTDH